MTNEEKINEYRNRTVYQSERDNQKKKTVNVNSSKYTKLLRLITN